MLTTTQKQQVSTLVADDHKNERIIRATYWDDENKKGCAIGCIMHSVSQVAGVPYTEGTEHSDLAVHLGGTASLYWLADSLFEALPKADEASQFAVDFAHAVTQSQDLSQVVDKFLLWLLRDVRQYATNKEVVDTVVGLYEKRLRGEEVTDTEWKEAHDAASRASDWSSRASYADRAASRASDWSSRAASRAAALASAHGARRQQAKKLLAIIIAS